jgi:ESF2/ABP1 family protein
MSAKSAGKKRAASPIEDREDIEQELGLEEQDVPKASTSSSTSRPKSKKRKSIVPGIVYISRLPPGMTPQKVKYLMAQWGEVGKIYAQKKDGESFSSA